MARFGIVPPEPPRITSLDGLAPKFRVAVEAVLADVPDGIVYESGRVGERQNWLAGFGVRYDDGRGQVTHALSPLASWHGHFLAVDIIHRTLGWNAPGAFWDVLNDACANHALEWGGHWHLADKPHCQWGAMPTSPQHDHIDTFLRAGVSAVWVMVGAA